MKHVVSEAPHEFAVVTRPKQGLWHMVAVRAKPGPSFKLQAVAGIENRDINVFGGATVPQVISGDVGLWASARGDHQLSGLRVTAEIIDPSGTRHQVMLHDADVHEPESGSYGGVFTPTSKEQHRAIVRVENTGGARIAGSLRHALHAENGHANLTTKVPRFVRVIPFYFDVGRRPEVRPSDERPGKEPIARRRRCKLVSAERTKYRKGKHTRR